MLKLRRNSVESMHPTISAFRRKRGVLQVSMSGKMLKQNAVESKNVKLKCHEFSALQKREIKMQQKLSVLQYVSWMDGTRVWQQHVENCLQLFDDANMHHKWPLYPHRTLWRYTNVVLLL